MSFIRSPLSRPCVEVGFDVYFREPVEGKDGREDYAFVNQSKELPPMSTFRLKNQLESGVNLERVDTRMIQPRVLDLNSFEQPKQEQPKQEQTKQEQTKQEQAKLEQTKQEQPNNGEN